MQFLIHLFDKALHFKLRKQIKQLKVDKASLGLVNFLRFTVKNYNL